jgi:hypothetical protein
MSLSSLLNSTATVYRVATTQDAVGGLSRTFSAVYTDIPCLLQPYIGRPGGGLETSAAKRKIDAGFVLYTDTEVSVMPGDKVTTGGLDYIVRMSANHAGQSRLYAIYLDLITG